MPWSINDDTIFCIVSSSVVVGLRSSSPMTTSRTVPRPTYDNKFGEMPPFSIAAK